MIHPKLARFIDLERMEKTYQKLIDIDLDKLSKDDFYYVLGAIDGILSLIGINNKIAKIADVNDDISDEQRKELLKQFLRENNPDAIDVTYGQQESFDPIMEYPLN